MNQLYNSARQQFLEGQISWTTMDWFAWLLSESYVFDPTHRTMADIPATVHMKRSLGTILNKTAINGFAYAQPITFGRVLPFEGIMDDPYAYVVFAHATSGSLLWYGDDGFNLPFVADGTEAVLYPDFAFGGYFRL